MNYQGRDEWDEKWKLWYKSRVKSITVWLSIENVTCPPTGPELKKVMRSRLTYEGQIGYAVRQYVKRDRTITSILCHDDAPDPAPPCSSSNEYLCDYLDCDDEDAACLAANFEAYFDRITFFDPDWPVASCYTFTNADVIGTCTLECCSPLDGYDTSVSVSPSSLTNPCWCNVSDGITTTYTDHDISNPCFDGYAINCWNDCSVPFCEPFVGVTNCTGKGSEICYTFSQACIDWSNTDDETGVKCPFPDCDNSGVLSQGVDRCFETAFIFYCQCDEIANWSPTKPGSGVGPDGQGDIAGCISGCWQNALIIDPSIEIATCLTATSCSAASSETACCWYFECCYDVTRTAKLTGGWWSDVSRTVTATCSGFTSDSLDISAPTWQVCFP